MSAMLLMRKSELHVLADDLESFLHVLGWIALRYMSHELKAQELTDLVSRVYEHSYQGSTGAAGGDPKMLSLKDDEISKKARFHNTKITALIRKLTETVASRYFEMDATPADAYDGEQDPLEEALKRTQACLGERSRLRLDTGDWMLKTFRDAAAKNPWPTDDKAKANKLANKRKRDPLTASEQEMARLSNFNRGWSSHTTAFTGSGPSRSSRSQRTNGSYKRSRQSYDAV
jgi:hypothetical protein